MVGASRPALDFWDCPKRPDPPSSRDGSELATNTTRARCRDQCHTYHVSAQLTPAHRESCVKPHTALHCQSAALQAARNLCVPDFPRSGNRMSCGTRAATELSRQSGLVKPDAPCRTTLYCRPIECSGYSRRQPSPRHLRFVRRRKEGPRGPAFAAPSRAMRLLDTDNDGTVDLDEAKRAASMLFDKLDRDSDGTLDRRELRGRLSATDFAAADPDKDGTLSKDEYLKVVESRFKAADPDNDGTLDEKELRSRAGQALLRLLQ